MSTVPFDYSILDKMVMAVELVRDRLRRAAAALESAHIPYAVIGGNAVAAWVAKIDPAGVRNTQDVDMILARADLEAATTALAAVGFIYRHVRGIDMFLDGPGAKARDAVHILFAGEKVREGDLAPAASLAETERTPSNIAGTFQVVSLEALVRMKLTSYRDKDRTHLRDLIEHNLVDDTWPARFAPELGARLQAILDTPDG